MQSFPIFLNVQEQLQHFKTNEFRMQKFPSAPPSH